MSRHNKYRNGKTTYLTSLWSKKCGIKITWIFTESGHGKSAADGIGGGIKNLVVDKDESDGKMWQKNLPSENFYKPTRIKIGRQMVRSTAEDALDEIDEDGSDFD